MRSSSRQTKTLKSCLRPVAIFSEAMMKKIILFCALFCLLCRSAMALTLVEARTQGRVGETYNGYLVALAHDAETQILVREINEAR
ncbi:TPA: DUF1318 domain-containing protein, partial [Escherichia coli]|nr:DUF1318 domain-containing protein [Escherichia coli]